MALTQLAMQKSGSLAVCVRTDVQYLADIEEHLGVTIDQVDTSLQVTASEFDGKVTYGQKRRNAGTSTCCRSPLDVFLYVHRLRCNPRPTAAATNNYTVIHNYGNAHEKWNIFIARPHLWLQLGVVKPEIMLCETVLNLSTLNTLTYLRTACTYPDSLGRSGSVHY